jgi:arsenite methyltransferase
MRSREGSEKALKVSDNSDLQTYPAEAGFSEIRVEPRDESREFIKEWAPDRKLADFVMSALIRATKS